MTVSAARLLDSVGRVIQSFHNLRSSGRLLGNPPLAVVVSSSRVSRVPPHLSPRGLALCAPHRATHGGSVAQDEIGTRDTFVCGTSLSTVDRPRLASVEHSCFRPCWEVLHFFFCENLAIPPTHAYFAAKVLAHFLDALAGGREMTCESKRHSTSIKMHVPQ